MFLGWPHRLISPFVKWAGGKGQLVDRLTALMPDRYNRYYEPFVGGGAMLLAVQPKDACINDINASLINTYRVIRDSPEEFIATIDALSQTPCTKLIYAVYRDAYNQMMLEGKAGARMAALFVYLNKHCFNGLYRVNSKGAFNVPWNNKAAGDSISPENIRALSQYLQGVEILCGDFEDAVKAAGEGDFVFLDSPYAPLKGGSFESYTKDKFSQGEHERLARLYKNLTDRGCYCIATNHDTELVRNLYSDYNIQVVPVRRSISANGEGRTGTEVIIKNY